MEKLEHKIAVKDLTLIFGKNKAAAIKLLNQGKSKAEILEKTNCTVGVNKASFEIKTGEVFVIMGLSGSGKSTLLRCINRLIEPTSGTVWVNGDNITKESNDELLETRRTEMSMVFQKFALLPHRSILENAAFGLEIRGEEKEERHKKAQEALETVGLKGFENQKPNQLSGGMQQRVGLARALANNPEVLLMDEAFSALDPLIKSDMQDELLELQEKLQKTIVFITHDLDEAIKLGDRIAIMKDGVIEQIGTAEDIIRNPASDYVKAFVEKVDRKTIVTAESLMFTKPTVVQLGKDGPEGILRKMRANGTNVLPVVDKIKGFQGFVWLPEVIKAVKQKADSIDDFITTQVPSVYKHYTVEDMLPLISDTKTPIAVVDEDTNRLKGIVAQASLIIEATRFDKDEIADLKEQAMDQ
ncbi:quaternary amine ABC transporter ATP-binding protein [Carboxylicivirga taeanensis]|uniref:quaternary amine ABC transporter ATP-binding protein n=1 Tax=Carboxylicivirga taeanensis TaxID=1416875 RepID=UPI003F6E205D